MTMFEQSQQTDWLQTELELMSSQEDSPAKTSQPLEDRQALRASAVDYGQSAPVLLGSFSPDTPSLKTSQTCLMENGELGLSEFSGTFPRSGMMRNGTVYQLPNLARTITEIGSGLWPTPDTTSRGARAKDLVINYSTVQRRDSGQKRGMDLQTAVKYWPTPRAQEAKHGAPTEWEMTTDHAGTRNSLRVQVNKRQFWPTPNAGLHKLSYHENSLHYYKKRISDGRQIDLAHKMAEVHGSGALNPTWVEWLMGFPIGHTDLNA